MCSSTEILLTRIDVVHVNRCWQASSTREVWYRRSLRLQVQHLMSVMGRKTPSRVHCQLYYLTCSLSHVLFLPCHRTWEMTRVLRCSTFFLSYAFTSLKCFMPLLPTVDDERHCVDQSSICCRSVFQPSIVHLSTPVLPAAISLYLMEGFR